MRLGGVLKSLDGLLLKLLDPLSSKGAIHINPKVILDNQRFPFRDCLQDLFDLLLEIKEFRLFHLTKINCERTTDRIT